MPAPLALRADVHLGRVPDRGQLPVGEAELLGLAQQRRRRHACRLSALPRSSLLHLDDLVQILQEPRVDAGQLVDLLDRHAAT